VEIRIFYLSSCTIRVVLVVLRESPSMTAQGLLVFLLLNAFSEVGLNQRESINQSDSSFHIASNSFSLSFFNVLELRIVVVAHEICSLQHLPHLVPNNFRFHYSLLSHFVDHFALFLDL
jgi:hypothetical protein